MYFAFEGGIETVSIRSLAFSTLLLDAASISIKSSNVPLFIPEHISHSLHGFPSIGFKQFIAFANILAVDVLPVPLVPEKR